MPLLPILQAHHEAGPDDLVRFYHRALLHWCRHLAEETQLDAGIAQTNRELGEVHEANCMMDVALPEGLSAEDAFAQVEAHFAERATRCYGWLMASGAPEGATAPMVQYLQSRGYVTHTDDILHLAGTPATPAREDEGLKIIPARASFRHARELAEEGAREDGMPQLAGAAMLHLDDPHVDALLALKDGKAAGKAAVLAVGEIGFIADVFVSAPFRRQGIGRTLMSRAMEICTRSLFKHVLMDVDPANAAALALYAGFGFRKAGVSVSYYAPGILA